jgi:hypothetical protein
MGKSKNKINATRRKKIAKKKRNKTKRNLEKMNCNPVVEKTKIQNSCYTPDALEHVKSAYNSSHEDKVLSTETEEVWKELRDKITECPREDCWLDQIKDPDTRVQLDNVLFAPDRPKEWDKDPVSWLSNYDIEAVLKQYERSHPEFKLLGPSAIDYDTKVGDRCVWDELCRLSLANLIRRNKRKLGIVFNLDKHDGPGTHWVAMFVDLDDSKIVYFDSALNSVPHEVSRLKREIIKQGQQLDDPIRFEYIQNKISHQNTNTECGVFCLYFLITMLTRKLDPDMNRELYGNSSRKKKDISEVLKIFMNKGLTDDMMIRYREKYFNKK